MATATISPAPTRSGLGRAAGQRLKPSRPARVLVRRGLITCVRAQIAAGAYETESRLDAAAARLLAEIA